MLRKLKCEHVPLSELGLTHTHKARLRKLADFLRSDPRVKRYVMLYQLPARTSFSREVLWRFLFDMNWREIDNTSEGAALRIEYVLKFGVPSRAYLSSMLYRGMPLPYDKPTQEEETEECHA